MKQRPDNIAGWGCGAGDPLQDEAYRQICEAMKNDPDIVRYYFVPFWEPIGCGWDFEIETVEGVNALQKLRFYWEEFLPSSTDSP